MMSGYIRDKRGMQRGTTYAAERTPVRWAQCEARIEAFWASGEEIHDCDAREWVPPFSDFRTMGRGPIHLFTATQCSACATCHGSCYRDQSHVLQND